MWVFEGGPANQGAEETSEVSDSNGHRTYGFELHGRSAALRHDAYRERAEARTREEARGAYVVAEASQLVLAIDEHLVDERAVRAGAGHHDKVARAFALRSLKGNLPYRDNLWLAVELLERCLYRIERKLEMPRQGIGGSQRNHSEGCLGLPCHALQDFVDGAVAPAGEDDIRALVAGLSCLEACSSGSFGRNDLRLEAPIAKHMGDAFEGAKTLGGMAS